MPSKAFSIVVSSRIDWHVPEELLMRKIIQVEIYKSVSDEEKLTRYAAFAGPEMMAAGGRILARGMPVTVKEAGEATRTVVIE